MEKAQLTKPLIVKRIGDRDLSINTCDFQHLCKRYKCGEKRHLSLACGQLWSGCLFQFATTRVLPRWGPVITDKHGVDAGKALRQFHWRFSEGKPHETKTVCYYSRNSFCHSGYEDDDTKLARTGGELLLRPEQLMTLARTVIFLSFSGIGA